MDKRLLIGIVVVVVIVIVVIVMAAGGDKGVPPNDAVTRTELEEEYTEEQKADMAAEELERLEGVERQKAEPLPED